MTKSNIKIHFINHACFIIESYFSKVICDPWLHGPVFNNGWDHISPTSFNYNEFENITDIWFSHEHPDHFNPPNLLQIPINHRRNIRILYQKTIDKKVVQFCKSIGFKNTIELEPNTYYRIDKALKILCNPAGGGDSYAVFKTKDTTILNLNDCVVNSRNIAKDISQSVGIVDILFTQFGTAKKIGNENDKDQRIASSKRKLERIRYQNEYFKPKYIIPFASYIYFSHEENFYMNSGANNIKDVYNFITNQLNTNCHILYPGDNWDVTKPHSSENAISKYLFDQKNLSSRPIRKSKIVPITELLIQSKKFINTIKEKNKNISSIINIMMTRIYLTDYKCSFLLSGNKGLIKTKVSYNDCDIALHSDSLSYFFNNLWGGDTLSVNARYQTPKRSTPWNFYYFVDIASFTNRNEKYRFSSKELFVIRYILKQIRFLFRSNFLKLHYF